MNEYKTSIIVLFVPYITIVVDFKIVIKAVIVLKFYWLDFKLCSKLKIAKF